MHDIYKNVFSVHLAPIPRRFAVAASVVTIGYLRAKTEHVRRSFDTFNFSFILRGQGAYRFGGQSYKVKAPCVITQPPGVQMDYGPAAQWEELFLIYNAESVPDLTAQRLIRNGIPLWPVHDPARLQPHLSNLMRLINVPHIDPHIDAIDTVCALLIMESMQGETPVDARDEAHAIGDCEAYLMTHLHEEIDFHELAVRYQMHPATFRRYWMKKIGIPPLQFLTIQRIKEACRLLVETTMPIGAIAAVLRFENALYFSRKFKQLTGITATEYRCRYRSDLSIQHLPDAVPARFTQHSKNGA